MSGYSEFVYCKITLTLRSNPAITKVFYFSNRIIENDSVPFKFQPLLISYNVGHGISGYIPKDTFGTVILDNEFSNHQEQFRFSDYLKEYEIIGQNIEFYISYNEDLTTNATLFWTDKISSFNYNISNKTLNLALKSTVLSKDLITYICDNSWVSSFNGSLGKPLPFIIGQNVQVKPILMRSWDYQQDFGYATTLADDFIVEGVQKVLVKDDVDRYVEVSSPADVTTALYQWANDSSGGYVALHDGEMASRINYDSSNPYVVTGFVIRCEGSASNVGRTIEGEIVVRLYKIRESTGKPQKQAIEEFRIDKTNYSNATWESTSEFLIRQDLSKPIVMSHEHGYFISVQVTNSPDGGRLRASTRVESGRVIQYRNDESRGNLDSWQAGNVTSGSAQETSRTFIMHFFGVKFTDLVSTQAGVYTNNLGLAPAVLRADSDPLDAFSFPNDDLYNLSDLDLIFEVNGIKENTTGAITGVPNVGVLTATTHILKLLSFEWSGSSWLPNNKWNSTIYSQTHGETDQSITPIYLRTLNGATQGITRKNSLIADIARNTQCLIVQNGIQQYGAFFIGTSSTASQTIYADECRTLTFSATDQNAIITRALMFYNRKIEDENKGLTLIDQQKRNYGNFILYTHDDGGVGQSLLEDTHALYGDHEMDNTDFNWLSNTTHAQNVLNVLLRRHDMPHAFVTFEVPRIKEEDLSYNIMVVGQVFNLVTPELPSTQGTTTYNNFNPASKTNTQGNYRADTYKCQVIQVNDIKNQNSMAFTRYVARIILSSQDVT